MITFRVKVTDCNGVWWTDPFAAWVDALRYCKALHRGGCQADIAINDRQLAALVAELHANILAEQQRTGQSQLADFSAGCMCGEATCSNPWQTVGAVRVPTPAVFAPVIGGFPLLDQEPGDGWKTAGQEPAASSERPAVPPGKLPTLAPTVIDLAEFERELDARDVARAAEVRAPQTIAWPARVTAALAWGARTLLAAFGDWLLARPRLRVVAAEEPAR